MPLSEGEMCIILFETDRENWQSLPPYRPFSPEDCVHTMHGTWKCTLIPTMDNTYGDWRLPAYNTFLRAEARASAARVDVGFSVLWCRVGRW